ncbi:glutamate decarboxylase, partial [Listeria seeligeri FSL S4-171]
AEEFAADFHEALHNLEHARVLYHDKKRNDSYGFTH